MNKSLTTLLLITALITGPPLGYAQNKESDDRDTVISLSSDGAERDAAIAGAKAEIADAIRDLISQAIEHEGEIDNAELEAAKQEIREAVRELVTEVNAEGNDDDLEKMLSDLDHMGNINIDSATGLGELVLGGLAIIFIFGTPIMIVAAVLYASYRKRQLAYRTMNQLVEAGKEIPEEILRDLHRETTPKSTLHKGLIWSAVGLGILACFAAMGSDKAAFLGLIPLFIGLAQLLIWKLDKGADDKQAS